MTEIRIINTNDIMDEVDARSDKFGKVLFEDIEKSIQNLGLEILVCGNTDLGFGTQAEIDEAETTWSLTVYFKGTGDFLDGCILEVQGSKVSIRHLMDYDANHSGVISLADPNYLTQIVDEIKRLQKMRFDVGTGERL